MSFPAGGILCTGNVTVDILVRPVDGLPPWGATQWVDSIDRHVGGNGAICAYALGMLGAPVKIAGMVGNDDFGRYAIGRLESAGVDVSLLRVEEDVQTAVTVGLIQRTGQRLFLHALGASDFMNPGRIRFDAEVLRGISYFHFASMFQMPKMRAGALNLVRRARRCGLFVSFDTMWDTSGRWMQDLSPLCPEMDCLFVNQEEARMLAGTADPADVGRFFRSRGVGIVVFKMGAEGCAVFTRDEEFHEPAFAVPAVDTTGAGDSFCGAFLAAVRRGFSLREAARFANAVGACCIQVVGGTEGVRSFEETIEWLEGRDQR